MFILDEQDAKELKVILDRVLNQQFVANTAPAHRIMERLKEYENILNSGEIPLTPDDGYAHGFEKDVD